MKNKSFTLIELLVVIVIIGILAGVIIVSVSSSINKANFAKAQSFSNTVQNELLGDLVSEWTFNSPAVSGKTEDSWGNNDGTLYGANGLPQLQTKENCVYGSCYLFDGEDDYIDCGDDSSLKNQNLTISFWANASELESGISGIIGTTGYTSLKGFGLYSNKDNVYNIWAGNGTLRQYSSIVFTITVGWSYYVVTKNENNLKIYKDGIITKEDNIHLTNTINYDGVAWSIGQSISEFNFKGLIDDVRIYNAALSSAQIKQQYVAGLNSLLANNSLSKEEYLNRIKNLSLND